MILKENKEILNDAKKQVEALLKENEELMQKFWSHKYYILYHLIFNACNSINIRYLCESRTYIESEKCIILFNKINLILETLKALWFLEIQNKFFHTIESKDGFWVNLINYPYINWVDKVLEELERLNLIKTPQKIVSILNKKTW